MKQQTVHDLETARLFSTGQFNQVLDRFSAQIAWNIIGQQRLDGIHQVTQHCLNMQRYFDETAHVFKISKAIQNQNICMIQGTAQFNTEQSVTDISACDIYTFNRGHELIYIESYCIILPAQQAEKLQ